MKLCDGQAEFIVFRLGPHGAPSWRTNVISLISVDVGDRGIRQRLRRLFRKCDNKKKPTEQITMPIGVFPKGFL